MATNETVTSAVDNTKPTQSAADEIQNAAKQNAAATPRATDTYGVSAPKTQANTVQSVAGSARRDDAAIKNLGITDAEMNGMVTAKGVNMDAVNGMRSEYTNIADSLKRSGVNIADERMSQRYDTTEDIANAQQQRDLALQQYNQQVDYATQKSVDELNRAKQEADEQYLTQRQQSVTAAAKAKDNAALYASSRGDNGGIGQAQYNQILAEAARAQMEIGKAQTKTANDTARQISDLRAQGEFEKADKLLEVTQQYLAQLQEIKQWAAQYNLSVDQTNNALVEWEKEFNERIAQYNAGLDQWQVGFNRDVDQYNNSLSQWATEMDTNAENYNSEMVFNLLQKKQEQANYEREILIDSGNELLAVGIMPSADQLAAMGLTESQAQDYIDTLFPSYSYGGGGGGGYSGGGTRSNSIPISSPNAESKVSTGYDKYGQSNYTVAKTKSGEMDPSEALKQATRAALRSLK